MNVKNLAIVIALVSLPALAWPPVPTPKPKVCKPCELSESGLALIKQFEGFRPYPYRDSAGLLTIGFGHLMRDGRDYPVPLLGDAAENLLREDVSFAVRGVNRNTEVQLRDGQFSALVSFTYNLGTGAYKSSTLRRRVNDHRHDEVPSELMKWVYVTKGGKKIRVSGLENRRIAEGEVYLQSYRESWLARLLIR